MFNKHFIIGGFLINGYPEELQTQDEHDMLSDMDDGYEISYFIKSYPGLHKVRFVKYEESMFDCEQYTAYVQWEDYQTWTQEMKDFWDHEKDNDYFKTYLKRTMDGSMSIISCKYSYDSDQMNSILIDPSNLIIDPSTL